MVRARASQNAHAIAYNLSTSYPRHFTTIYANIAIMIIIIMLSYAPIIMAAINTSYPHQILSLNCKVQVEGCHCELAVIIIRVYKGQDRN